MQKNKSYQSILNDIEVLVRVFLHTKSLALKQTLIRLMNKSIEEIDSQFGTNFDTDAAEKHFTDVADMNGNNYPKVQATVKYSVQVELDKDDWDTLTDERKLDRLLMQAELVFETSPPKGEVTFCSEPIRKRRF